MLPPTPASRSFFVGYPEGATAYFRYLHEWRSTGDFTALRFS